MVVFNLGVLYTCRASRLEWAHVRLCMCAYVCVNNTGVSEESSYSCLQKEEETLSHKRRCQLKGGQRCPIAGLYWEMLRKGGQDK